MGNRGTEVFRVPLRVGILNPNIGRAVSSQIMCIGIVGITIQKLVVPVGSKGIKQTLNSLLNAG